MAMDREPAMTERKVNSDFWKALAETLDRLFTRVSDVNEHLHTLSVASLELARDRQREITGLSRRWIEAPSDLPRLAVAGAECARRLQINYVELSELWLRGLAGRTRETADLVQHPPAPSKHSGEGSTSTRYSEQRAEATVDKASKTQVVVEAYCLRCRSKRSMHEPEEVVMEGGRVRTQGKCSDCGRLISRMGSLLVYGVTPSP